MLRHLGTLRATTSRQHSLRQPLHHVDFSTFTARRLPRDRPSFSTSFSSPKSAPASSSASEDSFVNVLLQASRSWRPLAFAGAVSVGFYAYAADYTNRDTAAWSKRVRGESIWRVSPPNTSELIVAKTLARRDALIDGLKNLKRWTSSWSQTISTELQRAYVIVANMYLATPEATRTCYSITTINTLVFLAWRIPRLQPAMRRHFLHDPLSGRGYTLLTSVFSHQSFVHLLFNSLALNSFGAAFDAVDARRPDTVHMAHSTNRWHFLGFYIASGLFASSLSHIVSTRFILPRILKTLADPTKAASLGAKEAGISPSLGASGAIYGVVAMTALALPETNISLVFLPMFPFPITLGLGAMVSLDIMGIIRGWKVFDHWAHLGGAVSGMAYFYYAPWEWVRAKLWPLRVQ